jgi:hypothetical protein
MLAVQTYDGSKPGISPGVRHGDIRRGLLDRPDGKLADDMLIEAALDDLE